MSKYYTHTDKKSKDGLAITDWNELSNAVAGNQGLHLALDANDKVGIGTTSPSEKLEVIGDIKIGDFQKTNQYLEVTAAGENKYKSGIKLSVWKKNYGFVIEHDESKQGLNFHFNNPSPKEGGIKAYENIVFMKSSGNVGIGTTSPSEKLEVNGKVKATKFEGDGSELTNLSVGLTGLNLATESGNVGIGTTSPSEKLEVIGDIKIGDFQKTNQYLEVTAAGENKYKSGIKLSVWKKNYGFVIEHDESKQGLNFHFNNPSPKEGGIKAYENIVFMKSSGNVGIGTDDPKSKLDVEGGVAIGATYSGTNAAPANGLLVEGKVGIGTTNPEAKLHVHGVFKQTYAGNTFTMLQDTDMLIFKLKNSIHGPNKSMSWDGDTNWDSYSDKRLKTNIEEEKNILKRLVQLKVKNFNWRDNPDNKRKMIGFIAQEVQPLFPTLVKEHDDEETNEKTLTIPYASFGVLAVGAIKELNDKFEKLTKKVDALAKKVK